MRVYLARVLVLAAGMGAALAGAADDVRIITVEGEGAKYWPQWRGPSAQGHVSEAPYADAWSPTSRVAWKVPVPGRGNSSPIVWGDRIYLTTAHDGRTLTMLAFNRADGKLLWETAIPQDGVESVHQKNGYASATPVADGQRIYASFGRHGLVAFAPDGRIAWQRKFGAIENYHGPAGSPVLYKDRIFLYQDQASRGAGQGGFVAAFDKATGRTIWQTARRETVGWGTPVVINSGERDELIVSGQGRVVAYDPASGKELWTVTGNTFEVIPTPVVAHGMIFASSGRAGPTLAIRPGGSGDVTRSHVVWSTPRGSPFVPSGIVVGDLLYLVNDMQSILTVYDARTGTLAYQGRLGVAQREGFSASPVAVNGKVFFTNDDGQTFVVQAGREFKLLHVNELGARTLASPALVDGTWYWRSDGQLVAIR